MASSNVLTMAGKKKRKDKRVAQLARRKLAAKERKLTTDLGRLFALGPGGSAKTPLLVPTPALVKPSAEAMPCPLCAGRLHMSTDEVDRSTAVLLRIAHCECDSCGAPRKLWFRIQLASAN
ncbi:MAG: hypothetical protein GY811_08995 [Myxococcales bacterium]|nr:hypothetical protein [Myxococcales bacterium]